MIKTVKCRLNTSGDDVGALDLTLEQFAAACTYMAKAAQKHGVRRHRFALQASLYHDTRKRFPALTANYVQRVTERVATRVAMRYKPTAALLDNHLVRFIEPIEAISISTCMGRRKISLQLSNYQRRLLAGYKKNVGTLCYCQRTRAFYIHFAVDVPTPEPGGSEPLGVDLGIKRIATLSNGVTFSGRTLNRKRERYARTKASLQRKGTKGAKRLLKRLAGREHRFQRDTNHVISKQIVTLAKESDSFLAMENLTGIGRRSTNKGRRFRRMIGRWNFYTLKQFIAYKAAEAGVALVTVDPRYTSRTCPYCGDLGHRKGLHFSCSCGFVGDADKVGAFNIAAQGAQANRPEVAGCFER